MEEEKNQSNNDLEGNEIDNAPKVLRQKIEVVSFDSATCPDPILVTGCPRSGTSMIAGCIELCGAFSGLSRIDTQIDNDSVSRRHLMMLENELILNRLVYPYFEGIGADPKGQFPLPNSEKLLVPTGWRKIVQDVFASLGYDGKTPWMYKDSRISLIWPVWHVAFPHAKWVIVRRRTGDIVESCLKTNFMSAFKDPENCKAVGVETERDGWIWWVHEYEKRFVDMISTGLNVKIIWPERMVYGDFQQLYELMDWLGLSWNTDVLGYIDPKLWTARRKAKCHLVSQQRMSRQSYQHRSKEATSIHS